MSINITQNQNFSTSPVPDWEPPMPPEDLIFDDGEPLESNRHRIAMNVLIQSLQQAWSDRNDYFVGGNMFVYYSRTQARNRDFKGPGHWPFQPGHQREAVPQRKDRQDAHPPHLPKNECQNPHPCRNESHGVPYHLIAM